MELPVIMVGGGDHARVVLSILLALKRVIIGYTTREPLRAEILGVPCLGDDGVIEEYPPDSVRLVNGVGSIRPSAARRQIFERFQERGYSFTPVIHPSAIVTPDVEIGEGAQIMAGSVVQTATRIGPNCIINTRAAVDHDCIIAAHAHIAPGVVLAGRVAVGEGAHVGAGATVIQGVVIGRNALVGAGAVVVRDVPPGVTAIGVPARVMSFQSAQH